MIQTNRVLSLVSLVVTTALVLAAPSALAMTMPTASNTTIVLTGPVDCSIGGYAPTDQVDYRLNSNPDTVTVPFENNWQDDRTAPATPKATHYFYLQTVHGASTQSTSRTVETSGGVPLTTATLSLDVTNVYNGDYIDITYSVSLSGPIGANCPASGSFTGHYHFVT